MTDTAVILAAGYGTRLGINKSKPLIEVGGRPVILYILTKLRYAGIENIYIVTNNLYFEDYSNFLGCVKDFYITLINDGTSRNEERLGGLGDLHLALAKIQINRDVLVVLGDNLFEDDLTEFLKAQRPVMAIYDVQSLDIAKNYGVIEVSQDGKVKSFEEKPLNPKTTLISAGLYIYSAETLKLLDDYLMDNKMPREGPGNFMSWLVSNHHNVYTYRLKGKWWDIGSLESLNDARNYFK